MKKSKEIILLLVVASVFSEFCSPPPQPKKRLHLRADTAIGYSSYAPHSHSYVHFYPYGVYNNGVYTRTGYYNSRTYNASISHNSPTIRGGMGRTGRGGFSVGS